MELATGSIPIIENVFKARSDLYNLQCKIQ